MVPFTVIMAAAIAAGYFTIAAVILPRIQFDGASRTFVRAVRAGGGAFFVGCGLTHAHIAVHAVTDSGLVTAHEIVFHVAQVIGVWVFVFAAIRLVDVRLVRRRSPAEQRAEDLRRRVDELSRSNADLEEFAHVVSHDLREPLATVSGFAHLMERRHARRGEDRDDEVLRQIREGCARMSEMLDALTEYSRAAATGVRRDPVSMEAVVRDAQANLAGAIAAADADVVIGPLPEVLGDRVQLVELLQNLLSNAIKFSDGRPRVAVTGEQLADRCRFAVRDWGRGVDAAGARDIFEMFQRGDASAPGRGVGLAVCRKIVQRHGGEIWAEAAPGGGSRFSFTLPCVAPQVDGGPAPAQDPGRAPAPTA